MKKILSLFGFVAISSLFLLSCARGGNDNDDGDFGSSNSAKNATWLHHLWKVTHYKVGEGGNYKVAIRYDIGDDYILDFRPDGKNLYYCEVDINPIELSPGYTTWIRSGDLTYKVKGRKVTILAPYLNEALYTIDFIELKGDNAVVKIQSFDDDDELNGKPVYAKIKKSTRE